MAGAAATAVLILAAAAMTVAAMVVMAAAHIRIVGKLSPEESCNCRICITCCTAIQLDTCFCQCHLGTTADAAANQHIRLGI